LTARGLSSQALRRREHARRNIPGQDAEAYTELMRSLRPQEAAAGGASDLSQLRNQTTVYEVVFFPGLKASPS